MALTDQQMQHMDQVSGLSDQQMQKMDQASGLGGSQQPEHTGGITRGASDVLRSLGLGILPNTAANIVDDAKGAGSILSGHGKYTANAQTYDNPFRTYDQAKGDYSNPTVGAGKDIAGMLSWLVPEMGVFKGSGAVTGAAAKAGNLALQGAAQGGLQAASNPNATSDSVLSGLESGAVANPILGGVGNTLTNKVPAYLGFRAYGKAGLKLPDVLNAQHQYGTEDLQGVRDYIIQKTSNATSKGALLDPIRELAAQPGWVGTPGLSEQTLMGGRNAASRYQETGKLKDIEDALNKSNNTFDFYSRLKNMAYPTSSDSPAQNRLATFMRAAAHQVRETLINNSDDPATTRKAMDTYAAQMAIKAAKSGGNVNSLAAKIQKYLPEGEAGLGAIGMLAAIPGVHQAALPLILDAALTNKVVGPKIAGGLVKAGRVADNTGVGAILKRLGVGVAVNGSQPNSQGQASPDSSPTIPQ